MGTNRFSAHAVPISAHLGTISAHLGTTVPTKMQKKSWALMGTKAVMGTYGT